MREWLLKDEKKNKVGRPKLADDTIIKKSVALVFVCLVACFILTFGFICSLKNVSPIDYAHLLITQNLFANVNNKNGFIINEKYDKENNYIMNVKTSKTVDSYSGSYKYVLYKLTGSKWKKVSEKKYPVKTKSFDIKIDSLKNKNQTYKISLYILNASKIEKSFAPFSWDFSDSSNQSEKHAYKVFTVKGYYSPVPIDEINEIKEKKEVVNISTDKENPRIIKLSVPNYNYSVKVKYTDETDKEISLLEDEKRGNESIYKIPSVNKSTKVTIKVWIDNISKEKLEKIKLSSWILKTDSKGQNYIETTYILKPEKNYKGYV